jgi:hypothetical protein
MDTTKAIDEHILQLLSAFQATPASAQPQATHAIAEVEVLRTLLQAEDPLLAPHAAKIYDALGITALHHLSELTADDIASVALPKLQQNHMHTLWTKHNKK